MGKTAYVKPAYDAAFMREGRPIANAPAPVTPTLRWGADAVPKRCPGCGNGISTDPPADRFSTGFSTCIACPWSCFWAYVGLRVGGRR